MTAPEPELLQTKLQNLVNIAFDRAKWWTMWAHVLQFLLYVTGALAVLYPKITLQYPWVAVPIAMVVVAINTRVNGIRSDAERLKRQLEYYEGFGFPVSGRLLADYYQKFQVTIDPDKMKLLRAGNTYASTEGIGAKRAAENLSESAWYSGQLAGTCATWLSYACWVTLLTSLSLLLYSAISLTGSMVGVSAARCVAATLIFIVSGGMWRAKEGFSAFSNRAKEIDVEVDTLLEGGAFDLSRVQCLLGEYQLVRAQSPLIPTIIWKIRRNRMNEDFKLRTQNP